MVAPSEREKQKVHACIEPTRVRVRAGFGAHVTMNT
jgi:hypothetical protein